MIVVEISTIAPHRLVGCACCTAPRLAGRSPRGCLAGLRGERFEPDAKTAKPSAGLAGPRRLDGGVARPQIGSAAPRC